MPLHHEQVNEVLYESTKVRVARRRGQASAPQVVIKAWIGERDDARRAHFLYEYKILVLLAGARARHVPKPIELQNDPLAIVTGDIGGRSLRAHQAENPLNLDHILHVAIAIAEALVDVHRAGVTHKDVNPNNIIYNIESGAVELIDFEIASQLPSEPQSEEGTHKFDGTLAYMAPEQTGRMNRGLDYRADLYSLGATLYELIAKKPLFDGDDVHVLLHAILAKLPMPLVDAAPGCPPRVAAVVHKLLEKTPERRYQSAQGVLTDLLQCRDAKRDGEPMFVLGTNDRNERFDIPQLLYGREQEVHAIRAAYTRATSGQREMVWLSGPSGIGKSTLVGELRSLMVEHHGLFASGKFDRLRHHVPFVGLDAAINSVVRRILTESESSLHAWRRQLNDALCNIGGALMEVAPSLIPLLGAQKALVELPPQETENRLLLAWQRLICAICAKHPLVLFLDDVQWADSGTLKLLTSLLHQGLEAGAGLLIIAAFRDDEVHAAHSLSPLLQDTQHSDVGRTDLRVGPLALSHIQALVHDATHAEMLQCLPLAELVLAKTGGNPFFAREYLRHLYTEAALTYNPVANTWDWDLALARRTSVTDNVAQLMARRLQAMPAAQQSVLSYAACLGNQFDLDDLGTVMQLDRAKIIDTLTVCLQDGLLIPMQRQYRYAATLAETLTFKFSHDQIQHAAYALLSAETAMRVHYQIGHRLVAKRNASHPEEWVMDILGHLNAATSLVQDEDERQQLIHFNQLGAQEAKRSLGYATALEYLRTAANLLNNDWTGARDTLWHLSLEMSDCLFLSGQAAQAESLAQALLQRAQSPAERAESHRRRCVCLCAAGQHREAIKAGLSALQELDLSISAQGSTWAIVRGLWRVKWAARGRSIEYFARRNLLAPTEAQQVLRILTDMNYPAYFCDPPLFAVIGLEMARLTMQRGNSRFAAHGFANMGVCLAAMGRYAEARTYMDAVIILYARIPGSYNESAGRFLRDAFTEFTRLTPQKAAENYRAYAMDCLEAGDPLNAQLLAICHVLVLATFSLEQAAAQSETYTKIFPSQQNDNHGWLNIVRQGARSLNGQNAAMNRLDGETFRETDFVADIGQPVHNQQGVTYCFIKLMTLYHHGDHQGAVKYAHQGIEAGYFSKTTSLLRMQFAVYTLLAIAAHSTTQQGFSVAKKNRPIWRAAMNIVNRVADNGPEIFGGVPPLMAAIVAGAQRQHGKAMALFERATEALIKSYDPSLVAMAHECAARYALRNGMNTAGHAHLRASVNAYQAWGAMAKVKALRNEFPQLIRMFAELPPVELKAHDRFSGATTDLMSRSNIDLHAVLKSVQAVSSAISRDEVIRQVVTCLLTNTGATRVAFASGQESHVVVDHDSVSGDKKIPMTIVHWVRRSREPLVLDKIRADSEFAHDPYFRHHVVQSLMCAPIIRRGETEALLYMENQLTENAFATEHIVLARVLMVHTAVALEKARAFSDLESTVTHAQNDLHDAQVRLTRLEREATENQLAGGFGHEMRNALSSARIILSTLLPLDSTRQETTVQTLEELLEQLSKQVEPHVAPSIAPLINRIRDELTLLREALFLVESGVSRGLTITQQIIDYAHIGSLTPGDHATEAAALVDRVLADLSTDLIRHGAVANVQVQTGLHIPMQEDHVYMIVRNLVANAGDALRDTQGERRILVKVEESYRGLVVSVEDNGAGMSEATQAHVFRPFFTTKGAQGTGLGLGLARKLAHVYGGDLQFSSSQHHGTTFELVLPLSK